MGSVIVRYAALQDTTLARLALAALIPVWGERAIPVMLAALQSADDNVKLAALRGLQDLGGVDEFVVRKMAGVVDGTAQANDELRIGTVEALAYATPNARPSAARLVINSLTKPDNMMSMMLRGGRENPSYVVALAKAALIVAPSDARPAIVARAEKSPEPLKGRLLSLL